MSFLSSPVLFSPSREEVLPLFYLEDISQGQDVQILKLHVQSLSDRLIPPGCLLLFSEVSIPNLIYTISLFSSHSKLSWDSVGISSGRTKRAQIDLHQIHGPQHRLVAREVDES
jgi:hypothetical protein